MRIRNRRDDDPVEAEVTEAEPSEDDGSEAEQQPVYIVMVPHGDGQRVYGVYSSEEAADEALNADSRNRLEVRAVDGEPV